MSDHTIALFCKSYIKDIDAVERLVNSINKYNIENIPFYISIPRSDARAFKNRFGNEINLIYDESISSELINSPINNFEPGYINQQIVKMEIWKTGIAENYFVLDSDGWFIRSFKKSDFIAKGTTPYSVMYQDKELAYDPVYKNFFDVKKEHVKEIRKMIGGNETRYLTVHNFAILSSHVLRNFREKFLMPRNLTLPLILKDHSFEFSWYTEWLLKDKSIDIIPIEPLFKTYHFEEEYIIDRMRGITEKDIARSYLGICMNSNWARKFKGKPVMNPIKIFTLLGKYGLRYYFGNFTLKN